MDFKSFFDKVSLELFLNCLVELKCSESLINLVKLLYKIRVTGRRCLVSTVDTKKLNQGSVISVDVATLVSNRLFDKFVSSIPSSSLRSYKLFKYVDDMAFVVGLDSSVDVFDITDKMRAFFGQYGLEFKFIHVNRISPNLSFFSCFTPGFMYTFGKEGFSSFIYSKHNSRNKYSIKEYVSIKKQMDKCK